MLSSGEFAHNSHTKRPWKLSLDTEEPQGNRGWLERARRRFLQEAARCEPRVLGELHDIHRARDAEERRYPSDAATMRALEAWSCRWNLSRDGEPADWVISAARSTLIWWKRGRPDVEIGGGGARSLEWAFLKLEISGLVFVPEQAVHEKAKENPADRRPIPHLYRKPGAGATDVEAAIDSDERYYRNQIRARREIYRRQRAIKARMPTTKDEHLTWGAMYQVMNAPEGGRSIREITESLNVGRSEREISREVTEILRKVGLTRRQAARAGRPKTGRR